MQKNRGKDLAFNTLIIGIGKFSTQIVSFLLLPLYTSILTTDEYGIYDLIITISTFLLPVVTLLMEESMFRFLIDCKKDEEKKKVISQTLLYLLVSTIFFIFISNIVNLIFQIKYFTIGIIYIMTSILVSIRNSLVRGLGKIKLYTFINFITSLLTILLNIIFVAFLRYGIYGLLLSVIISNILISILTLFKLKINKYISISSYNKNLMKDMIKYSIPLVPNSLSWAIVNLSDRIIISSFIGLGSNGVYSIAYKFPNLMNTIYSFFYTAWKESSAKAMEDVDKEQFFNKVYIILTNIMKWVSIGIIVCMPIVFDIFIKEAYKEAYMYIPILVLAMYYNNMSGYYGGIFSGYKDTKIMGTTTIIGAVINVAVNIILIKFIGIYAAAFSTLISCIIIYYYRKIKVKKYIKLDKEKNIVFLITLFITLVCYYINNNLIIKLINLIIVIILAFYYNKEIIFKFINPILNKINFKSK